MTEGNKKRLEAIAHAVTEVAKNPKDAQHAALTLLQIQERIGTVLLDLTLRPEVNSCGG